MRRACIGGLTAALTACSLVTSLDGYTNGGGAAPRDASIAADAPTSDGATPAAIPDASVDAPLDAPADASLPNLHPNGNFDTSTTPWYGFQADPVTLDTTARTGSHSLRACTAPATTDYFTADDQGAIASPVVGATYHVVAWVRATPDKPAPPSMRVFLRTISLSSGFVAVEGNAGATQPVDANWLKLETTLTVTMPAERLNAYVGASWAANACFLLDDVVVERVN